MGYEEKEPSGMKRFWTFIKHSRSDTVGMGSLNDNGNEVTAPVKVANILNSHFQSVSTTKTCMPEDMLPTTSPHPSMPDIDVLEAGVLKLLLNLKIHKAAGPDQLRPRILKELATTIVPMLTIIMLTPIFKKGKRSDAANYRPISLTCVACKIMEHIFVSGIMKHASKNDLLYQLQCGFREKYN